MKLMIAGADGQAGSALISAAGAIETLAFGRAGFDIRDGAKARELLKEHQPDWLVNFAAFHVLDACEDDFASAMAVNAIAVRELALAAHENGARFLTVSTDYVFDGKKSGQNSEDDMALPLQAYGVSKRAGELAALSVAPETSYVVRTCGLYGAGGSRDRNGNFIDKRFADAQKSPVVEVGSDLVCTPTSAKAFAEACLALMQAPDTTGGIYHLTAEGECSWAEFTEHGFAVSGISTTVKHVDRKGAYGRVKRPTNSVLINNRARAHGIVLPHWRDDLSHYIQSKPHAVSNTPARSL